MDSKTIQNKKIVIVGGGLTGFTYANLLTKDLPSDEYDIEIYEKRSVEDIDNLDSNIYITNKTLEILSPFIDKDMFSQGYELACMSTKTLKEDVIEFKLTENNDIAYRVIGPGDIKKIEQGIILRRDLPEDFPETDQDILNQKSKWLPLLLIHTTAANKTLPKNEPKAWIKGKIRVIAEEFPNYEDHSVMHIAQLLRSLIAAAEQTKIPVHRSYELQKFYRNKADTATMLEFTDSNGNIVKTQCDILLLACGSRAIKSILEKNNYKQPLEISYTPVLGTCIDYNSSYNYNKTADINYYLESEKLWNTYSLKLSIAIEQVYSFITNLLKAYFPSYFSSSSNSIGHFSLYAASSHKFTFFSTYPGEKHKEVISNKVTHLRTRLAKMRIALAEKIPEMDYTWLENLENMINENNIISLTGSSIVHLPDKLLVDKNIFVVGDGFVTTSFIFGSSYNDHVQKAYPKLLHHLNRLKNATDDIEICRNEFIDSLWDYILNKDCAGKYLLTSDLVANTRMYDGLNLNMLDAYFLLTRNALEKLSNETPPKGWIPSNSYQIGGSLYKPIGTHDIGHFSLM